MVQPALEQLLLHQGQAQPGGLDLGDQQDQTTLLARHREQGDCQQQGRFLNQGEGGLAELGRERRVLPPR